MYAIDPLTKEKFIPKRRNQKFSKRENQIVFNNNKAYKKRQEKAPFDNILESNRKILNQILGDDHKSEAMLYTYTSDFYDNRYVLDVSLPGFGN